jgi:coronin-1B/1C/6
LALNLLDKNNGVAYPYFDSASNILFMMGKGEPFFKYYEVLPTAPYLEYINTYTTKESNTWCTLLPKRIVDCNINEVMRVVRLTSNMIQYLQFRIPTKV